MLSDQDIRRVSAESMLDPRTVAKAYGGRPVSNACRSLIRIAAEALGLEMPPPPTARLRAGS